MCLNRVVASWGRRVAVRARGEGLSRIHKRALQLHRWPSERGTAGGESSLGLHYYYLLQRQTEDWHTKACSSCGFRLSSFRILLPSTNTVIQTPRRTRLEATLFAHQLTRSGLVLLSFTCGFQPLDC